MVARRGGLPSGAVARIGPRRDPAPAVEFAAPGAGGGILGAMQAPVEQPPQPGEQVVEVPLAELAPHPANIRHHLGDTTDLAESIREYGVETPLVVVTRAAFSAANPDVALPVEAGWVVIAGHRRRAAALTASLTTVPCLIRDRHAGPGAVAAMILENLAREGLTPIEEARAFGRLRNQDWSERRIAAAAGCAPGQVHKRLSLLRLPPTLADAVTAGFLTVRDALELLQLPDGELVSAWEQVQAEQGWRDVKGVVAARRAAGEVSGVLNPPAAAPAAKPVTAVLPAQAPEQTVPSVSSRTADTLTGASCGSDSAAPASPGSTRTSASTGSAASVAEPRVGAADRRAAACALLVTRSVSDTVAAEILADCVLNGVPPTDDDRARAANWCQARTPTSEWVTTQARKSRGAARRIATAVALAAMETEIAAADEAHTPWTDEQTRHVRRLIKIAGYTPTDHDHAQLGDTPGDAP